LKVSSACQFFFVAIGLAGVEQQPDKSLSVRAENASTSCQTEIVERGCQLKVHHPLATWGVI
jgi:hypothetical protein